MLNEVAEELKANGNQEGAVGSVDTWPRRAADRLISAASAKKMRLLVGVLGNLGTWRSEFAVQIRRAKLFEGRPEGSSRNGHQSKPPGGRRSVDRMEVKLMT